jgi:hypothetical protein
MINLIQRSLRPLLVIVLILISVPFIFITTGPVFERNPVVGHFGKINGHDVTRDRFSQVQTSVYVMLTLQYGQAVPDNSEIQRQVQAETWKRLLLLEKARQIGLVVDDAQVLDFIRSMPALQKDGQFQPDRFANMLKYFQQMMGISENRFTETLRDELTVEKMERLLASPIQISPKDVEGQFNQIYGAVTVSTITLPFSSYLSQTTATAQEVDQEYKNLIDHDPSLRTKERRRVSYIFYPAPAVAEKKDSAAAKDKDEARRQIGEKALEFALALEPEPDGSTKRGDFAQVAKSHNLTVATTAAFAVDETPASLPPSPNFNRVAFSLSNEHPTSSVVDTPAGFYVLKLEEITASQPRPLTEVKSQLEDRIKKRKALALIKQNGAAAADVIRNQMAKGVPFRSAAAQLKLSVETLSTFVPGDSKLGSDPKLDLVRRIAAGLKTGQPSPFIPTAAGGVIAVVDARQAPDRKTYSQMEQHLQTELIGQAREQALNEWVRLASSAPGTSLPPMLTQKAE